VTDNPTTTESTTPTESTTVTENPTNTTRTTHRHTGGDDAPRHRAEPASDRPGDQREPLRMWGGIECTINRVGDYWSDQDRWNRHSARGSDDLRQFEDLGLRMVRYPVLWEATAPDAPDALDFGRSDERMEFLRESSIEPIVGLLHHGSGPHYTSLVDPEFPEKLAEYARQVAERYPWATHYTPVNEPLTTARFSGLYGVWYPHGRDDRVFARALYNEVRGTALAMQAIRRVNPDARLVQTDDLGRATGTDATRPRVEFENHRRWLGFDLLMGRVTSQHPMFDYLVDSGGLTEQELALLVAEPCPPDVIGVNHYLLSSRFLDDRTDLYPEDTWCPPRGAQEVPYADVPALETRRATSPSIGSLLREVWERYPGTEFAITEVHVDGDADTQLQWLWEVWRAASRLHREGAPILGITVWSLLGTFDWNTLCTTESGGELYYEPGVFDVRSGVARPTPLATMVRSLASAGTFDHPALQREGYWRQETRFKFAHEAHNAEESREELAS
jgi:dTDP-4-dehydrorhamnose reductase